MTEEEPEEKEVEVQVTEEELEEKEVEEEDIGTIA